MSENPKHPRVFISYAREDARPIAERLRDDLTAAGYPTWLDLSNLSYGADWERAIEEAIGASQVFLPLMTVGYYVSDVCRAELSRAGRTRRQIVPLLVDADADRPLALETRNYIDLTGYHDDSAYATAFEQLVGAIASGRMPGESEPEPIPPAYDDGGGQGGGSRPQKYDARAFRRYLADLRAAPWLGSRRWWPRYLFYYNDVQAIATILERGALLPAAGFVERKRNRWDHEVRLYFRPRTPELFSREGCRPEAQRHTEAVPVPVYLLFDAETLLTDDSSRFCEGDPAEVGKTYKAAARFRELPFDLIYHDTWFRADQRDEVMQARRAQVILPEALSLDALRHVWCRSSAELETLRTLLPPEVWRQWRNLVTARADYVLFNRRWRYVEEATLLPDVAYLRFAPCDSRDSADCGPFDLRATFTPLAGKAPPTHIDLPATTLDDTLALAVPAGLAAYELRVSLDDSLVYAGRFQQADHVW